MKSIVSKALAFSLAALAIGFAAAPDAEARNRRDFCNSRSYGGNGWRRGWGNRWRQQRNWNNSWNNNRNNWNNRGYYNNRNFNYNPYSYGWGTSYNPYYRY